MTTKLMTIFTRTPLHVGAGASVGAVDSPIIRERHTQFPVIPGSSIKGVLSDLWNDENSKRTKEGKELFGNDDTKEASAGALMIGEGKLLAFPVRSAKGCFAWITCPLCLQRFARESGITEEVPQIADDMTCLAGAKVSFEDKAAVVLEEYRFKRIDAFPKFWADKIIALLDEDPVLKAASERFVLLSDADMKYFAQNACQVSQHVCIDSERGTAVKGKLFNEEEVPSDTLFYAPVSQLKKHVDVSSFVDRFSTESLLQFGGKETTGIGYCSVKLV